MTKRNDDTGLDFGALRLGIERCDLDLLLGLYAEDAILSIVNAGASQASPFELYGKAEIAKHLRATFGQESLHRVEGEEVVGDDRLTFWEACEYPDGSLVWVKTTLEVNDGKIVRQVDVVAKDIQADCEEEIVERPLTREIHPETNPRVDLGSHSCEECRHPEMRLLPDGVSHCPGCGSEVLPTGDASAK